MAYHQYKNGVVFILQIVLHVDELFSTNQSKTPKNWFIFT